ncbi:PPOX class F420-dependent enzyme [Subtercola boreus]|uniref:PPOX class F420-dependent enzyme n=1 Tax=Subtercola boreus TaxID=120213 RepID=A0A3E0VJ26_9MICO|nr:PPOX class F420-dependent oxidoreductase [Subtercola boreus]RFA09964.1 PPOX class F420-dependent enzyme [Subtercola boreus]TQL52892.1 PPOX class probable F420-dependent enzyme [Subtercola boreus]
MSAGTEPGIRLSEAGTVFVTDRHLAILTTLGPTGRLHSVPVGFTLEDGIARIITSDGTQKVRNAERGGQASVAQVDGGRWLSFQGPSCVVRDAAAVAHAVELYAGRYRQPGVNPRRVVIEITVERALGSGGLVDEKGGPGRP